MRSWLVDRLQKSLEAQQVTIKEFVEEFASKSRVEFEEIKYLACVT